MTGEVSGQRILLVEDNPVDRDLVQRQLAREAPELALETVGSIAAGLARLERTGDIDLLLTDLRLPDGSGLELLTQVRERKLPVAVLVLTGSGDQNAAVAALKAGADGYLAKRHDYLERLPQAVQGALANFHRGPRRPHRPLRVLYAEPNAADAELTHRHLARHAPHVRLTTVSDAEALLSRLATAADGDTDFDIVLLEDGIGEADGLELARRLRDERGLALPIVLVSARGSEDVVASALNAGVSDYIAKHDGYLTGLAATLDKVREQDELSRERKALRETSAHLSYLLGASPVVLYTLRLYDGSFLPTWAGGNVERILGSSVEDALRPGWWLDHLHADDRAAALAAQPRLLREGHLEHEYRIVADDGRILWIRDQMRLVRKGPDEAPEVVGIWTDITHDKRAALLQEARGTVLNRLVADDPLAAILDDIVRHLEQLEPAMRATVLLLDPRSGRLTHGSAPSLPDDYLQAVEGLAPGEGACGAAVQRGAAVFATDVQIDPLFAQYREIAERVGFRACWSFPFRDAGSDVIGTLAVYFDAPREPDGATVALIDEFAALAALAVQKVRATAALRQAAAVIDSTRDGVMITDLDRRIVSVNRAWCEMTGFSECEALGRMPQMLRSGLQDDAFYRQMWSQIVHTGYWQGEVWNRRKSGALYPQWLSISTVFDESRTPTHYVGVMTDISRLKESEAQLERLAHYDPLTDLPNRLLVQSRLQHAIEQAARREASVAVLFIDLDRFKTINDSLGHAVGDELLKLVARRLRGALHADDTLARWGGDEFLVVIENAHKPDEAASAAQALIDGLQQPCRLADGQLAYVGASIGIGLFPQDARSAAQLIQHADTALSQAKAQGRNTYRFFTDAMGRAAQAHLALERRLRAALERRDFVLHYQPQVDVASGRVTGCEALLRWNDPDEGLIAPNRFIPFAEESGLIVPIGEWVLECACRQARAWQAADLAPLRVAVNLSARQLWQAELPARIADILARTGLPPDRLELELTESMIMGHERQAVERLGQLRALGVHLALDDFGTGYSSLSYLKNLPIEVLKIDQSFVRGIPADRNDMEIAAGIIALARKLQLGVLAEGVETAEQLAFLREQGCHSYQGFHFSRPLPAEEFEKLLS